MPLFEIILQLVMYTLYVLSTGTSLTDAMTVQSSQLSDSSNISKEIDGPLNITSDTILLTGVNESRDKTVPTMALAESTLNATEESSTIQKTGPRLRDFIPLSERVYKDFKGRDRSRADFESRFNLNDGGSSSGSGAGSSPNLRRANDAAFDFRNEQPSSEQSRRHQTKMKTDVDLENLTDNTVEHDRRTGGRPRGMKPVVPHSNQIYYNRFKYNTQIKVGSYRSRLSGGRMDYLSVFGGTLFILATCCILVVFVILGACWEKYSAWRNRRQLHHKCDDYERISTLSLTSTATTTDLSRVGDDYI